jgi:hypothetical protein
LELEHTTLMRKHIQCVKWLGLSWLDPPTQIKSSQN